MGILASQNPEDKGVISDDGFEMGRPARSTVAWLARLGLGALGVVAFVALIADIDAVT